MQKKLAFLGVVACVLAFAPVVQAKVAPQIIGAIDDNERVVLSGNTRPEATSKNDRGRVADDMAMDHMLILLKRSASSERALEAMIAQQQDPKSSKFQHWLTAKQFGAEFGVAKSDVRTISSWLTSYGFHVDGVQTSNMLIEFSGTAGEVRQAFHTEIHNLTVKGVAHIANVSDPEIPAALAPAVAGIVALHDFRPHTNYKVKKNFTTGTGNYAVTASDLATIYNFNPAFSAGYSGQGQTIVVIEDSDVFKLADWAIFRDVLGLSGYTSGSISSVHPSGANSCTDPGANGNEDEATIDMEWATAAAPSAAIEIASCRDSRTTFGGLLALENLINGANPPPIYSISYGECEANNGATANAAYDSTYQQAVSEGLSIFVSTGDEGAASCDANQASASHGIGVSGFASSQYDVAVGGTDFGDTFLGETATYWNSGNNANYGSAKSYIPEIPWNDSCAGQLLYLSEGFASAVGPSGFCNSTTGADFLTTASGSGGPSGCFKGMPKNSGVANGSCAGYTKPSYQSGLLGNPADGVRDIPDVALFAANGLWSHYYVVCDTSPAISAVEPNTRCDSNPADWAGFGGTSVSTPIMAGIQALINQKKGHTQGNPNPRYYALANAEYGSTGNAACNSTLGNGAGAGCVFYDTTLGDMDVNCVTRSGGPFNCFLAGATNGALSVSNTVLEPAYTTTVGWDFATGIGSVNVWNLLNAY